MPAQLPASPHDISPEWLTTAFRAAGLLSTAAVTHVVAEIIGADRGFTGVVARLSLAYSATATADLPATVVVKMPHAPRSAESAYQLRQATSVEAHRQMLQRGLRELRFYDEIVPVSHVAVPSRLLAASDAETLHSILMLEDLNAAVPGDGLTGCSPADAELVLCAIAALHAHWWQEPSLPTRRWLAAPQVDPAARLRRYCAALPAFLARHQDQIPASFKRLLVALETAIPALLAHVGRIPQTLIHADLHLDNVMFTPAQAAAPVHILDWQSVSVGSAAQDLATLLSGALDPAQQRAATPRLLDAYHAALVRGGVADYSRQRLQSDYQVALLLVIVSVVIWLGNADWDVLEGRERAVVAAAIDDGRLIAAAESQDVLAAIPAT